MALPEKQKNCVDCTKKSSCFNQLNKADHKFIEDNRLELNFKAGEVIVKQGSFASNIMFIYDGLVKTYLETADGSHVILDVLPPGEMIGLSTLFCDKAFNQSASAIEDSTICSINIKIFEEYTKSNGEFAVALINMLNCNLNQSNQRFLSKTHKQLNGKFADTILFLSEKVYKSSSFKLSMMRKDLAELAGMSAESLTRVLTKFKNEKIIKVDGKNYEILNMDQLKHISDIG